MRHALTGTLAAALALTLAGCGGGDAATQGPAAPPAAPAPEARARPRAIWIGDSLAARGWRGVAVATAPGSFVVSGTGSDARATVETVAPHGLLPGARVQLVNPGDPDFAASLNGAVTAVLAVITQTRFVVAAGDGTGSMEPGDYSEGYAAQPWLVRSMLQGTDESWLSWLNVLMNGHFVVVANYAVGGARSDVAVSLLRRLERGPAADIAFIQTCTNDINAASPPAVDHCLRNVERIVEAVRARGMLAVVATPPAIGAVGAPAGDPASVEKAMALREVRNRLVALRDRRADFELLDLFEASADPTDPLARHRSDYAPQDGIHPSSVGALQLARAALPIVRARVEPTDWLIRSASDPNLLANGAMTGSAGSVTGTTYDAAEGTAPDGWSLRAVGGLAAAPVHLRSTAGVPGLAVEVEVVAGRANQGFELGTNGAGGESFHGRLEPGRWYRCGFELRAVTTLAQVQLHGQVHLAAGANSADSIYFMAPTAPAFSNGMRVDPGGVLQYVSQPFQVQRVPTSAHLFVHGRFSGDARGHRLALGRATCLAVADPYG